eukprot:14327064-Alexandrium_andersonii.AAC.1
MIRRQETIHCLIRDSKILDALKWYASEEDDVVKLATRWNRRKEKSLCGIVKEGCSSRSSEEYYAAAA